MHNNDSAFIQLCTGSKLQAVDKASVGNIRSPSSAKCNTQVSHGTPMAVKI